MPSFAVSHVACSLISRLQSSEKVRTRSIVYTLPYSITEIIRSYLAGEDTDASVEISSLAERTVVYSGSDLKHLVFSAALAAFKDTLPHTWGPSSGVKKLPGRVIGLHHFEQALKEIVASASVNMAGIAALRKWGGSSGV